MLKLLAYSLTLSLAATPALAAGPKYYHQAAAPATCTVGDLWIDTDATAGNQISTCTAANTWTKNQSLVGDCAVGPCLDGSADGGNLIKLWAGTGSYWTALQGGSPAANRSWRLPIAAAPAAGETLVMTMDEYGQMGFLAAPETSGYVLASTDGGVLSWAAGGSSGDDLGSATYSDVIALWTTCTGYLKSDGTCDTPSGSATYPSAAGVANWNGSAWGTSYTVGTAANNLVQLNASAQLPAASADLLTITDTGTYFTTDTVGAALQELGSELAGVTEITLDASLTEAAGVLSVTHPVTNYDTDGDGDFTDEAWFPSTSGAPTNATYLTATAEDGLSAESNLGALTTGLLKVTVADGTATPSTAAAGTDYVAPSGNITGTAGGLSGTPNITVGTISAGAGGFGVDADGDVTAKSVTVTRTADPTAIDLYEGTGGGDNKLTLTLSGNLSADVTLNADQILDTGDVDDTPVNGVTDAPVSSNWAYDHEQAADPHAGYVLESALGTGVQTALGVAVGSAGAPVLFGGAGGTPSSLTLTNAAGLQTSGLTIAPTVISSTQTLSSANGYYIFNGAYTATLPAVSNGQWKCFQVYGAHAAVISPDDSDLIILDGVALADGIAIESDGTTGNSVCLTYYDATGWITWGANGWASE